MCKEAEEWRINECENKKEKTRKKRIWTLLVVYSGGMAFEFWKDWVDFKISTLSLEVFGNANSKPPNLQSAIQTIILESGFWNSSSHERRRIPKSEGLTKIESTQTLLCSIFAFVWRNESAFCCNELRENIREYH